MPLRRSMTWIVLIIGVAALIVGGPASSRAGNDLADMATEPDYPSNYLLMPLIDAARGRILFVNKGCVMCHAVNGVGGKAAPALDATPDEYYIDPFAFMVRMWRGAKAMITLQNQELGYQIDLEGDELAAIIGFVYDSHEQSKLSLDQVPPRMRDSFVNEPLEEWVMLLPEQAVER